MSEFVKLTGAYGSGAFYINVQRVESFYDRKDGATYVCTTPDGDQAYEVTETPEQIMALIDGPADRDALVETLRVCREQFAFYVEQHKAKGTLDGDEKAQTNVLFVNMIDGALALVESSK